MDCVKSRIQVMSMTGRQEGFFRTFMTIARTEGRQRRSLVCFIIGCLVARFTDESFFTDHSEHNLCLGWGVFLFRREGTLLRSYPHHGPHLPCQWSAVPGL